ncbi:MAG TPA: YraN family protein [Rhodospirillales bacterium]|nr:YraN family protein [Rhodospirillales bacterium]
MNRGASRKRQAYRFGHMAETVATWLLRLKGYGILARRYKTPVGEIDIVARRGDLLVMVEVKARTGDLALESLGPRQRRRIERAALAYVARHPGAQNCHIRFDLIMVGPGSLPHHLAAAWIAGD